MKTSANATRRSFGATSEVAPIAAMPRTYQSIVIDAPAARVWQALRDFHDVSWAPEALQTCTPVGELKGDQIGARRVLNDAFHETLLVLSDLDRTIKYRLDDGPSPVSPAEVQNFVAVIRVHPVTADDAAFVEWSASWEAGDDAACDFSGGIYAALLAELKRSLLPAEA